MARKVNKTAKKLAELQSSLDHVASGSNAVEANDNMTTTGNGGSTAALDEGHPPVITRKKKQNRKNNAKRNAKNKDDVSKEDEDSDDAKLAAIAKILSQNRTNVDDQETEQDDMDGKDSEESQGGIMQAVRNLLLKQISENAQTSQDSSMDKNDGENYEKAKLQANVKILGQESTEDQDKKGKKSGLDGNMTKNDQPHDENMSKNKAENTFSEPNQDKSATKSNEPTKKPVSVSLDLICGGPCEPCTKMGNKLRGRITELEAKRKSYLANYDTMAGAMMARVHKKGRAHGKRKLGGYPEETATTRRLEEIKQQVEIFDKVIAESELELETTQLECNARRLETYIHQQEARFAHISRASPQRMITGKYNEYKVVMADLREEAEQYRAEAAKVQGKATKPHEGPCPCNQPVSDYLLYSMMAVLVLFLFATFFDY